jgi:hypothetical protein
VPLPPPQPRRDDLPADDLPAYDALLERFGGVVEDEYFDSLLWSPQIAQHVSELGVIARARGEPGLGYTHADREWANMVLSEELRCWGVYHLHIPDAVALGVRPAAIRALRQGREEDLTPDERELTGFVRAVWRGEVTPGLYAEMERRFGGRGAVEYTAFLGLLAMTFTLIRAFHSYPTTEAEVDELLDSVLAGAYELPGAAEAQARDARG